MSDAQFAPMPPPTYHPARGVPPAPALGPHVGGRTEDQHSTDGECDKRCTTHEYPRPTGLLTQCLLDGEAYALGTAGNPSSRITASMTRGVALAALAMPTVF